MAAVSNLVMALAKIGSVFGRFSIRRSTACLPCYFQKNTFATEAAAQEPLPPPVADGASKPASPHIVEIVESISKLTLLEVASLNDLLKAKLNIADAPMMPMGAMMAAPAVEAAEEEEAPKEVQTEFSVKLLKFDDKAKVKLIKEMKSIMTDMNLVQAKKFVESVPQTVKEKLNKEDADKLKAQLEAVGGIVEIE